MQSAVIQYLQQFRPSVCLSVRPSHAGTLSRRIAKTLVLWQQEWLGGDVPFHLKFALKVTHPDFKKRRVRPISGYNISTVRASEKSSIIANRKSTMGFPTSYRWSPYVTTNSPKGGSKSKFVFVNKNQFKSNKLCYKVSLCEKFQRQRCSRPFPYLTVGGKCNPWT